MIEAINKESKGLDSLMYMRLDLILSLGDNIAIKVHFSRKKIMQNSEMPKKAKTTVYMSEEDEILLDEIFIKRLRDRNKTDRSTLLCEGIRLLYEKEVMDSSKD